MKMLSASALAREMELGTADLLSKLEALAWIKKADKGYYELTDLGKKQGGEMRNSPQYGTYIVWPESIKALLLAPPPQDSGLLASVLGSFKRLFVAEESPKPKYLTSSELGKHFNLSNSRMNLIFRDLAWIQGASAGARGWEPTPQGLSLGAEAKSGTEACYVVWPEDILKNKILLAQIAEELEEDKASQFTREPKVLEEPKSNYQTKRKTDFWAKFPANIRTKDGHFVRSRGEKMIDDFLYMAGLVHVYEKRLPLEEDVYCDFYLPEKNLYLEYWGLEDDPAYAKRKAEKIGIYRKHGFNLLEVNNKDMDNLEDYLTQKLLAQGIKLKSF